MKTGIPEDSCSAHYNFCTFQQDPDKHTWIAHKPGSDYFDVGEWENHCGKCNETCAREGQIGGVAACTGMILMQPAAAAAVAGLVAACVYVPEPSSLSCITRASFPFLVTPQRVTFISQGFTTQEFADISCTIATSSASHPLLLAALQGHLNKSWFFHFWTGFTTQEIAYIFMYYSDSSVSHLLSCITRTSEQIMVRSFLDRGSQLKSLQIFPVL